MLKDQAPINTKSYYCRICGSVHIKKIKETTVQTQLESSDFKITDNRYGLMLALFKCLDCGFLQCLDAPEPTGYYKKLEDSEYEANRGERLLQAGKILQEIIKMMNVSPEGLRLLDVGAGCGILLEAATQLGFDAEGVEPSDWLRMIAGRHGCKIKADVIPDPKISGPYDVVTLVDVVEHVSKPFELIQNAASLLKVGGIIVVVTPDVKSLAARIMSWKWWHYRIAHIGYFSKDNIEFICSKLGLKIISLSRPSWFFSFAYLRDRLLKYVPGFFLPAKKPWMEKFTVHLNLRDSLMIIAKRSSNDS